MLASKQRFGASSEKTQDDEEQLYLFGEEIVNNLEHEDTEVQKVREHSRLKRNQGDKARMIAEIPSEVVECVINPDEVCDICSSAFVPIGKKIIRTELEFVPATIKTIVYVQYSYKCEVCGTSEEYPDATIRKASVPSPIMMRSLASPTCVAWIMYQKYVLAVPLYRQEKEWLRIGIELSRSNMSNWVIQCAATWLKPLFERMREKLMTCDIIMSDETTIQCNKEKDRKASTTSYFWLHRNGTFEDTHIILFQYTRTRAGEHARRFLEEFSGYHVSDAYAGYDKVEDITRCLCWSHLRRYYHEAVPLNSSKKEISGSAAAIGRAYCNKIFKLEKEWKNLPPEERNIAFRTKLTCSECLF